MEPHHRPDWNVQLHWPNAGNVPIFDKCNGACRISPLKFVNWVMDVLFQEKHVYLLKNGRISIAGLTPGNVDYVAASICEAVQKYS